MTYVVTMLGSHAPSEVVRIGASPSLYSACPLNRRSRFAGGMNERVTQVRVEAGIQIVIFDRPAMATSSVQHTMHVNKSSPRRAQLPLLTIEARSGIHHLEG